VVVCLEHGADLHMAQLMPLTLNVTCFSKIQIGFTFLVPAHLGSPGKRAVKRVCVCVCASYRLWINGVIFRRLYNDVVITSLQKNISLIMYDHQLQTLTESFVKFVQKPRNYYARLTASFPGQPG